MKYALITGASRGMGRATAIKLASNGYHVFSCDIHENEEEVDNITQIYMDVTSTKSITDAYNEILKVTNKLDVIVNFAGIIMMNSLIEIDEELFKRIYDINVFGAFRVNKIFFNMIKEGKGKIINTTSELANNKVLPFNAIYAISKKSIDAYSQGLTMELGLLNIPVVTLRPGSVKTPLLIDSNKEMHSLNDNTQLYKNTITKFKHIVDKEYGKGIEANKVANLVYKIINKKHPKHVYSINVSIKLKLLSILPTKLQLKIFKIILK